MMLHQGLTSERWFQLSLMEQLANVGMDIERTINWRRKGNQMASDAAFDRAIELLDFTIADPKHFKQGGTLKELLVVREALADYFLFDNEYGSSDKLWSNYFYCYNYAAALEKGR
jgi:hypothetical protein